MKISSPLIQFPGKASVNSSAWLPLWMHSMDTADILSHLLDGWLPNHIKEISDLPEAELKKLCRFLALTHDIGKLTPVFVVRILEHLPEIRQQLEALSGASSCSAASV